MLKKLIDINKKYFAMIAFFSVLLCSFWGLEYDTVSHGTGSFPLNSDSYVSQVANLDEIISSEEISVSTSQAAFIRQLSTRKSSAGLFEIDSFVNDMLPTLYFVFLAFMSLYRNSSSSSHRFIIRYIHNKDGQKA